MLFRAQKRSDTAVQMQVLIARALLEQGKPVEAARELEPPLAEAGQDKTVQLELEMARALCSASAGKPAAREELRGLAAQAARDGFVLDSLQARLDLARLALRNGEPRARAELRQIAREAAQRGLRLIARRAAAPLTRSSPSPSATR